MGNCYLVGAASSSFLHLRRVYSLNFDGFAPQGYFLRGAQGVAKKSSSLRRTSMYASFLSFSAPGSWSFLLCHPVFCENLICYEFINFEVPAVLTRGRPMNCPGGQARVRLEYRRPEQCCRPVLRAPAAARIRVGKTGVFRARLRAFVVSPVWFEFGAKQQNI